MKFFFGVLFFVISSHLLAQKDVWHSFVDDSSGFVGFKNNQGHIMVTPQFSNVGTVLKFENIISVLEEKDGDYYGYYVLKNGQKIGVDSVYVENIHYECEHDGFIRFQDSYTQLVGFFNRQGKVVVPALYNKATPFANGFSFALKDASEKYAEAIDYTEGQYMWENGKNILIDTNNNVVIENISCDFNLDLYSLTVSNSYSTDSTVMSFKGTDGKYYCFVSIKQHFAKWFLSNRHIIVEECLLDKITYRENYSEWQTCSFDELPANYKEKLAQLFLSINFNSSMVFLADDFPFHVEDAFFQKFLNNCYQFDYQKYPIVALSFSENDESDAPTLYFIKQNKTYSLFCFSF